MRMSNDDGADLPEALIDAHLTPPNPCPGATVFP